MLIQFEIFSGDELNKPMASVQILLLLYTTYSMYITCVIEIKYVYTKREVVYILCFVVYDKFYCYIGISVIFKSQCGFSIAGAGYIFYPV